MLKKGIVLRNVPYKDKDAVITVITEGGIVSFYAKGVSSLKSKNAPALNLYTYSSFEINEGPQGGLSLKEAIIINSFPKIYTSLDNLSTMACLAELILKDLTSEDAKKIYPYLYEGETLLNSNFDSLTILNICFAAILNISGLGLDVKECVICHKRNDIVGISFKDGGFICRPCFSLNNALKFNSRYLNIYRYIFLVNSNDIKKVIFTREENITIFKNLCDYRNQLTGSVLNSEKLVLQ